MKTISGYRVSIEFFVPADPNNIASMSDVAGFISELPGDILSGYDGIRGVRVTHQFVARHRIESDPSEAGGSATTPPAGTPADQPPGEGDGKPGGACTHDWIPGDSPGTRLCLNCGVVDDLLDLTGTALDRRARA